ncbi:DUF7504 family protein [Halobaculum sp. EA56]|uniref:DUF7504 family protein n=1 Tax=Halobaculum sp. EA56 TaxID=3421648 RepID=UPI003EC1533B
MAPDGDEESDESNDSKDESGRSSFSHLADRVRNSSTENAQESDRQERSLASLADSVRQKSAANTQDTADPSVDNTESEEWDVVDGGDTNATAPTTDAKTEAVLELIDGASNVLIKGPANCATEESLCSRLMAARPEEKVDLVLLLVNESPSERLSFLQNYITNPISDISVIYVQTYDRQDKHEEFSDISIKRISDPTDLRRIGILTSKAMGARQDSPNQTVLCVHSISDLINAAKDNQRVFRFLHVLLGRVDSTGARAHYHFDPDRHANEIVQTFVSLFDTVLDFDEQGSLSLE